MEDDDVTNNNSYFLPREPQDQIIARKKEKASTLEAIGVLTDMLDRMNKRIAFYDSVSAMPDELKTDPTKFMNMHNANQMTRDNLINERDWISDLLDTHNKTR